METELADPLVSVRRNISDWSSESNCKRSLEQVKDETLYLSKKDSCSQHETGRQLSFLSLSGKRFMGMWLLLQRKKKKKKRNQKSLWDPETLVLLLQFIFFSCSEKSLFQYLTPTKTPYLEIINYIVLSFGVVSEMICSFEKSKMQYGSFRSGEG